MQTDDRGEVVALAEDMRGKLYSLAPVFYDGAPGWGPVPD